MLSASAKLMGRAALSDNEGAGSIAEVFVLPGRNASRSSPRRAGRRQKSDSATSKRKANGAKTSPRNQIGAVPESKAVVPLIEN